MTDSYRRTFGLSKLDLFRGLLGIQSSRREFKRRLMLESLESRQVLAAFQVTSILESVNGNDGVESVMIQGRGEPLVSSPMTMPRLR